MSLLKEQEEFLMALVEAERRIRREQRRPFVFSQGLNEGDRVNHPGFPGGFMQVYPPDLKALARANLIDLSARGDFELTQHGFRYYDQLKRRSAEPIRRIETEVRGYLATERFRNTYRDAYAKWAEAEGMLWNSDSERQFTTIGHLCREALQDFTDTLVTKYQPRKFDPDKSHTVARLRSVIDAQSAQLGDKLKAFADALVAYWGTAVDLVQRQEHGAAKENEPLAWEDGRRVVFQTAIVMFEIDRALLL
jgi:hypothetical protein